MFSGRTRSCRCQDPKMMQKMSVFGYLSVFGLWQKRRLIRLLRLFFTTFSVQNMLGMWRISGQPYIRPDFRQFFISSIQPDTGYALPHIQPDIRYSAIAGYLVTNGSWISGIQLLDFPDIRIRIQVVRIHIKGGVIMNFNFQLKKCKFIISVGIF